LVEVRDLLMYNEEVRNRYLEALAKLPWGDFIKNREASWHSMRNIFIHTIDAIDYWVNFLQKEKRRTRRDFDEYKTMGDVRAYMAYVDARMRGYLANLKPSGLAEKYRLTDDAGQDVEVTAEDILIHVFEEVHHRGELIALMWQMDFETPLMGWKYL